LETETRSERAGLGRIVEKLGDPDIVRKLASELTASDLSTLLMEVASERASRASASDVLSRYRSDRFSKPSGVRFEDLRSVEERFIRAVPDGWEWVVLSPLVPFGAHASLGPITQDWVVSTVRPNEVAADPTAALALEAAVQRRDSSARRSDPVRLATIQRITRAQLYSSPDAFPHFSIFALVTAGRSQAGERFDDEALGEHLGVYVDALLDMAEAIELVFSVGETLGGRRLVDSARERWSSSDVRVSEDARRLTQQRYYRRACFKVNAEIGAQRYEVADGGFTDWTERLLGDRHERMLISGAGLDRPALAIGQRSEAER
jgi:hypothetical protein